MKKYYAVKMENGETWGVPAEKIADIYAKDYAESGEDYQENFDAMMEWFDKKDYEFSDYAKNNIDWSDIKDSAVLLSKDEEDFDYEDGWMNGESKYINI